MVENKTDETWVSIPEDEQTAAGLNFGDKSIRRGFIKKVYSILSLQLIVTGGIIVYFIFLLPQHYHDPLCHQVGTVSTGFNHNKHAKLFFVQSEIEDYENGDYNYEQVVRDKNHSSQFQDDDQYMTERCDKV